MEDQSGVGNSGRFRFGPFELDSRAGELRKHDRKVRLQEQPFQILLMLLEQPGQVVLREEIRRRLWANDTIVEFDHSINAAIKRLRDALGESAEEPRYIETVARRGYRFRGQTESEPVPRRAPEIVTIAGSKADGHSQSTANRAFIWGMAVILVIVAAIAWRTRQRSSEPLAVTHLQLNLQPADQLVGSFSVRPNRTAFAVSPDGRTIVFSATRGNGPPQLYARGLAQSEAMPIPGTDGGRAPFFSPDGRWIGFLVQGAIKKVPVMGGPPVVIYDIPTGRGVYGASWAEDGTLFFAHALLGVFKISSAGRPAVAITKADATKNESHILPQALPGGKAVIFTTVMAQDWEKAQVLLQLLETGERRVLIQGGADARYVSTGHLLYMKLGSLMAVPFDIQKLQVTGEPLALIENVMQAANMPNLADEIGAGQWAVSNSGTLIYATGGVHPNRDSSMVWVDRKGAAQLLPSAPPRSYVTARLSPGGDTVALHIRGAPGSTDIWTYDMPRGVPTRLTFRGTNWFPVWSPDGKRIVFASNLSGHFNLYMVNADGSGQIERLTTSEHDQFPSSWTASGNLVAFAENDRPPSFKIWILPMDQDRKPKLFLESQFDLFWPEFSPDGRWMAYGSREAGADEVYVQPYPGLGEKHRISTDGGIEPIWSANGRELLYRDTKLEKFLSVAITSLTPFRAEAPRLLFMGKGYSSTMSTRAWDISFDGQRFFLLRAEESRIKPVTEIQVLLNWTEALKRRSPTK